MSYKVAVIGLGYFSAFHVEAWRAQAGADVVAAYDPDPERRAWAAATYGVPVVEAAETAMEGADIVDIVAPPPAHADLLRAGFAQGRVLICQKPFCTSVEEAEAVTAEAEAAGARIVIHENFRFQPWHRTMKAVLEAGDLGEVYSAQFNLRPGDGRGARAYLDRQPAFQTMERLLIHETGVHFVDLFRWLFGEIRAVYADLRQLNPALKGEDAGLLVLEHDGGVRAVFDGNRLGDHATDMPRRTMGEMVIEGAGGTLTLDGYGVVRLRRFGAAQAEIVPLCAAPDESFGGGCVAALIGHVVGALQAGRPFENEARDYLPVMRAVEAAYLSAQTGARVDV